MSSVISDIIPDDWQRWSSARPSIIKPLTGGLSNQSFLISADNRRLVLRVNSAMSDALGLNRAAELQALLRADKAGLCAPLVYCDPQQRYLVSAYLVGEPWAINTEGLARLAGLLRGIHRLPAIDTRLDISAKLACYWRAISTEPRAGFIAELRTLHERVEHHIHIAESFGGGQCLCHNDLLAANLIAGPSDRLYAIDWEYAAMADPFYELAVIVEGQRLPREQQQLLLAAYLARPLMDADWQRLHHWRIIYAYTSVLWYAVQWSGGAMSQSGIADYIATQVADLSQRIAAVA